MMDYFTKSDRVVFWLGLAFGISMIAFFSFIPLITREIDILLGVVLIILSLLHVLAMKEKYKRRGGI